jgi:hypothetical protein
MFLLSLHCGFTVFLFRIIFILCYFLYYDNGVLVIAYNVKVFFFFLLHLFIVILEI